MNSGRLVYSVLNTRTGHELTDTKLIEFPRGNPNTDTGTRATISEPYERSATPATVSEWQKQIPAVESPIRNIEID